jgi:hypothetical protein
MQHRQVSKHYGIALIVGSLGTVGMMAFHPTGHDLYTDHFAGPMKWVHMFALLNVFLLLVGYVGLSHRLGGARLDVQSAACAMLLAATAVVSPIAVSAFIMPSLEAKMIAAKSAGDTHQLGMLTTVFVFCGLTIQAFAKVFVITFAGAIACWSVAMLNTKRFPTWLGILGILTAVVLAAAVLGDHLRLDVHGFAAAMLALGVWNVSSGVVIIRQPIDA